MVYVIGEIGVNHNGDISLAKAMIDEAKKLGLNAVKIQSFKAEKLVTKNAKKADYQRLNIGGTDDNQYTMLKKYELTFQQQKEVFQYAKSLNIDIISTPFDEQSLEEIILLDVPVIKIGSGDLTNLPLLRKISVHDKPVLLSTGMSTLSEIEEALHVLSDCDVTILHCTSNYPASNQSINLKAMVTMREAFGKNVGYSDHSLDNKVSCLAVGLGATVIEKHFTLDKKMEGPDHKASLDIDEMRGFLQEIKDTTLILGDGIKRVMPEEINTKKIARKSITLMRNIKKGEKLTHSHLTLKRPGVGIEPKYLDSIIGKRVNKHINEDTTLFWSDLDYVEG